MRLHNLGAAVLALSSTAQAVSDTAVRLEKARQRQVEDIINRGLPKNPTGVTTIKSPNGAQIRYKEPGKDGVCETTPGVNSYSGYVDLDNKTHMFFWFFEARKNPETAPISLWLNGGPGSDSMIGLFQELGPCNVSADLKSHVNPYAWNEVSNMLFLSQPLGVGFSYAFEQTGHIDPNSGLIIPGAGPGRYADVNSYRTDTTALAAEGTWEILQGFLANLPKLDSKVKSRSFNLWTESYGGHYGPAFFKYFEQENAKISSGKQKGVHLDMHTLGIGNGVVSELIQAPYYPEFARYNTYGIQAVNESIYNFMKTAYYIPGGCRDYIEACASANLTEPDGLTTCAEGTAICRGMVEGPYEELSGRGVYDIRHPLNDPTPPQYFIDYLNQAHVQNALGVNLNYSQDSSAEIFRGFDFTGDFIYSSILTDLEDLLNKGVRVSLYYGDADYICNWFGGEALSLQVNYTHSKQFQAAGYTPMTVNGVEYGAVRQYGNFSFLRIYEAGHEVPYYQPVAGLALFNRTLHDVDIATGKTKLTGTYGTHGDAKATHTEPYVPLPSGTGS